MIRNLIAKKLFKRPEDELTLAEGVYIELLLRKTFYISLFIASIITAIIAICNIILK